MKFLKLSAIIVLFVFFKISYIYATAKDSILNNIQSNLHNFKNDTLKVNYLFDFIAKQNPNLNLRYQLINQAGSIAKKANYTIGIVNYFTYKGMFYIEQGEHHLALPVFDSLAVFLEQQINYNESNELNKMLSHAYCSIGSTYEEMGYNEKALPYYYKSLRLSEKINDQKGLGRVLNNIGKYYVLNSEFEKGKEYISLALYINKKNGNKKFYFDNLNNLSAIYIAKNQYDTAMIYAENALSLAQEYHWLEEESMVHVNIAEITSNKGNLNLTIEHLLKAIQIQKENNYLYNLSLTYNALSSYYQDAGLIDSAFKFANSSYQLACKTNIFYLKTVATYQLYKIFELKNRPDSALNYAKLSYEYHDSIYNIESKNKIEQLKIVYEVEKKEEKIELLTEKASIQKRLQFMLTTGLILSLLLIVLLFFVLKTRIRLVKQKQLLIEKNKEIAQLAIKEKENQNRLLLEENKREEIEKKFYKEKFDKEAEIRILEEEKFKNDIKHKNQELSTAIILINNKNEVLTNLKERISKPEFIENKEINELINEIDSNIQLESDWVQFKLHFEGVHPDFFKNLKTDFSDLTENELKLCAYLKINLSTKEITQMLNITTAAIDKKRQRLRKKLNLDSKTGFVDFLMKY